MLKRPMQELQLQLPEEQQLAYNGLEITTLEDLLELHGHKPANLTLMLLLMQMFKKLFATKEEDVNQTMQMIQMEEIQILQMEAETHALSQLLFPHILPTDFGLYNGLGLEELLP